VLLYDLYDLYHIHTGTGHVTYSKCLSNHIWSRCLNFLRCVSPLLPTATVRQGMKYFLPQSRYQGGAGNYANGPYFTVWIIRSQIHI